MKPHESKRYKIREKEGKIKGDKKSNQKREKIIKR
jgi:hypothetical protein